MSTTTLSPREAAWTIHHRTGASITPCTLHERAGDVQGWVVQGQFTHQPQIYTDAELVSWAVELDRLQNAHRTGDEDLTARA